MRRRNAALIAVAGTAMLAIHGLALGGCTPLGLAAGAGATVGVAAVQERSVGDAARDATLVAEINSRLLQHDHVLFGRTGVSVVEGRVLLTGSLDEQASRDEAERIAWTVPGVREVMNEIQVEGGGGITDFSRDAWITTQFRAKLLGDRRIADINYGIETVNRVIYLIGIAQDQTELERVVDHARTIAGVRRVISHVRLKDDPRRTAS